VNPISVYSRAITLKGDEPMVVDEAESVGVRIRLAREARGLSVVELAKKAGCSEEYLDWAEEGQVQPPVALLIRLARALRLDSGTFLETEQSTSRRKQEADKRTEHYSYRTLTPSEEDSHLMAFSITIPPKTPHTGVGYRHEGEEFVYVLSGEVVLTIEKKKTKLARRECLRFNSNLDHHLSNPGPKKAELLVILYLP
jgi:transcriptional regulator with XRE-family HTH domain